MEHLGRGASTLFRSSCFSCARCFEGPNFTSSETLLKTHAAFVSGRERNIPEIFSMYEVSFAKLSERFFKGTTWPPVEYIAELVDKDSVFCLLYKVHTTIRTAASQPCIPHPGYAKFALSRPLMVCFPMRRRCTSGICTPRCSQPSNSGVSPGTTTAPSSTSC